MGWVVLICGLPSMGLRAFEVVRGGVACTLLFVLLLTLAPPSTLNAQIIEEVALFGNTRTKPEVILRELNLKPGISLTDALLATDRAWLIRLDFLRRIELITKTGSTPHHRILMVVVREKGTFSASPGGGYDNLFGWTAGGSMTFKNLRGLRERLKIKAQIGGIRKGNINWQNPWMAGQYHLFTEVDLSYLGLPYLYDDFTPDFDLDHFHGHWAIGRQVGRHFKFGLKAGLDYVYADRPDALISGQNRDINPSVGLFADLDTRDWPFYPHRGHYWQGSLTTTELEDGTLFWDSDIDLRFYAPLLRGSTLAWQSRMRLTRGTVPVYERFHMGGGATLRGYDTGSFWGENMLLGCVEYRFPMLYVRNPAANIHLGYLGVLFVDTGVVWQQHTRLRWEAVRGSVGFGVHAIWGQWVIRAEYGTHGRGWGFITGGTDVKF